MRSNNNKSLSQKDHKAKSLKDNKPRKLERANEETSLSHPGSRNNGHFATCFSFSERRPSSPHHPRPPHRIEQFVYIKDKKITIIHEHD